MTEVPGAFARLRHELGLEGARPGRAIDHLLVRGLATSSAPAPFDPGRRDVPDSGGLLVRLSDHAPVVASYDIGSPPRATGGE